MEINEIEKKKIKKINKTEVVSTQYCAEGSRKRGKLGKKKK